ncbi:MAG TPA: prepilin-type N-terminal cleavage/methylation domain-containing protein [Candidatus Binatia bacterium]
MSGKDFSRTRRALRPGAGAGFTLIEVMLALSIFALLGTILYGAFALSHRAVDKSQASAARNQKQRSVADLLGSYIRSAYPYRHSPQEQTVFFDGASDSLAFVSAYSHGMGGRGMAMIHISVDGNGGAQAALRLEEVTPVRLDADEGLAGESHRVILEDRVEGMRIAYLDPEAEAEVWEERWDGKERRMLPRAVRFSYRDAHGKEVRWIFPLMMHVLLP